MADNCLRTQISLPQIQPLIIFMLAPDLANYLNMRREVILLRIQSVIKVTVKGISKQYTDQKEVREVLVNEDSQDDFLGVIHSETDPLKSTEALWTTNL